ncbi:MAG: hypothetical protein AAF267_12405 [Deinococcota bacterium]
MSRAFSFANRYNAVMPHFAKLILFLCLLLACISFAQINDSIFSGTVEFEDFPGETECVASYAEYCFHARLNCHTTTVDEIFQGLSGMPNLNADSFICTTSTTFPRGSMTQTTTWLRLYQNNQVADLYMLGVGSDRISAITTAMFTRRNYVDATMLAFENLDEQSYLHIIKNMQWGIERMVDGNHKVVMVRHESQKYLNMFSVVENSVLSTRAVPLADHSHFEEYYEQPIDENAIESYEEWLARIETLPDQLTYTLDWPNTLTISVNPGTEPTEEQLEWVGVHDLQLEQP